MVETQSVSFRLSPDERSHRLAEFNARKEILWFGFEGSFEGPGTARVRFRRMDEGALGGGGTAAINGGVISAGFDAAFVLAGLAQYQVDVVVTLELSVQFLNLALASEALIFEAEVVRSSKHFCFAKGVLLDSADGRVVQCARASAMLAPVWR